MLTEEKPLACGHCKVYSNACWSQEKMR